MSAAMERLAAALADRYRFEDELGAGGMATVYLAADLKHDRKVAVKVLRPDLAAVLGAERFVQEIKTTAALSHPHILPLFDSGEAGGFLYYVMPYIEGETIRQKLNRETQFGIDEAVRIATEVADALDYAHRHGVIHRDIKPENILLHDGRPMVMDFGIALALSAAAGGRMTETGLSLGTPHYMSPEQATADKDITARSDIYSLASVLYEMLSGNPPHMGSSAQQIIMKIIAEPVAPVTSLRKSVPPHVAAALQKSLEKVPADRFDSARAFAEALANAHFTLQTEPAAGAAETGSGLLWRRRFIAAATLAGVLGVAGTALLLGRRDRGSVGPTDVVRASLLLGDSAGVRGIPNLRLAIAPSGQRIAYIGPDGSDHALWVRDLDQPDPRQLAGTKGAFAPFFSPDGESIGFFVRVASRTALKVIGVTGGLANTVVQDSVAEFGGGDWGDDEQIYFTHANLGLARVASSGGTVTVLSRPDSTQGIREHDFPDVLPGSRRALILAWKGSAASSSVGLIDFSTGAITELVPSGSFARYVAPGYLVFGSADGRLMAAPFDPDQRQLGGGVVLMLQNVGTESFNGTVQFGVSETGTLVYQAGGAAVGGLVWVDRTGQRTPIDSALHDVDVAMALSPDGQQIALSRRNAMEEEVWVKQLATGALIRLSFDVRNADRPVWTPDGRRVAFLATRNNVRTAFIRRADGSDSAQAVTSDDLRLDEVAFDPLGGYTLLRTEGTNPGTRHLLVLEHGRDTVPRSLVRSAYDNFAMALSPNGRWMAYASTESGRSEVYVRPFPNVDSTRFVVSVGGGAEPLWRRDGAELFFRGPGGDMYAVPVTTAGRFQHGAPQLLFTGTGLAVDEFHRSYDVHPDGKRFLMLFMGDAASTELHVIFNWRAELRRLRPSRP